MIAKTHTATSEARTRIMRGIRSRDTGPELAVRSFLHQLGLRFRVHKKDLPGTPDIVLPKYRFIVFVHGCFWHQHRGCTRAVMPRTNIGYWSVKLARNVRRDRDVRRALLRDGWRVAIMWECEIGERSLLRLARQIRDLEAG